ncbi:MAG: hypothetical protein FWD17_11035, partial [Polyangiaceae bacterium]|nr:hypothetical protein [Polyangiaceae bacterium]
MTGANEAIDRAERVIARGIAWGVPVVTAGSAVLAGLLGSIGSALLVAASGALVGAIAFLWSSLRTLSGDAAVDDVGRAATSSAVADDLADRKRRVLLSIKDIESEHALGKLDDDDYEELVTRYRNEAKQVLREIDLRVEPSRAEAEQMARKFLAQ